MQERSTTADQISITTCGGKINYRPPLYSPDSKYLIVACNHDINIYSTLTGEVIYKLTGHRDTVTDIFFNPFNNLQIYSVSLDTTLRVWDYEEGKQLFVLNIGISLFATPSTSKENVVYVVTGENSKNVNFFEIYIGLRNRKNKNDDFKILGKESENITDEYSITKEEAKTVILGTGIYDPNGNEILKNVNYPEDILDRKLDKLQKKAHVYPAKIVNFGNVKLYYEKKLLFRVRGEFIKGICLTSRFLFFHTHNYIRSIDLEHATEGPNFEVQSCIATITSHPIDDAIAIGMTDGSIHIWDFLKNVSNNIRESLHWHSHRCSALQFSNDGLHLLSGGDEGVLVIWQLTTGRRQFIPGLNTTINYITISPNLKYYAVSTEGNCIHFINVLSSTVQKTITSVVHAPLKRYKLANVSTASCIVVEPRNGYIVAEGAPGILQFYNPITDTHVDSLVVARNLLGLFNTFIAHISFFDFTSDGEWLITVDNRPINARNDRVTEFETFLKFWKYSTINQKYELATQIRTPHKQVTCMSVSPTLVVLGGTGGKFSIWEYKGKTNLKNNNNHHKNTTNSSTISYSWICKSIGYYRYSKITSCSLSKDNSLLAIAYGTIITLWDPNTITLKQTLNFTHSKDSLNTVAFISNSPFLVAANRSHIYVWNLLTLQVLWSTELYKIYHLSVDPVKPQFTVLMKKVPFYPSIYFQNEENENKIPSNIQSRFNLPNNPESSPVTSSKDWKYIQDIHSIVEHGIKELKESEDTSEMKKIKTSLPYDISNPTNHLFTFDARNLIPLYVLKLKFRPRSGLVYINDKDNKSNIPIVSYLSGQTIVIIADTDYIKQRTKKSNNDHQSKNKEKSMFYEIYGELKEATKQIEDKTDNLLFNPQTNDKLAILDSPSHLIPSINILFPNFIDSVIKKSENNEKSNENIDNEYTDANHNDSILNDDTMDIDNDNKELSQVTETELFENFDINNNNEYSQITSLFTDIKLLQ